MRNYINPFFKILNLRRRESKTAGILRNLDKKYKGNPINQEKEEKIKFPKIEKSTKKKLYTHIADQKQKYSEKTRSKTLYLDNPTYYNEKELQTKIYQHKNINNLLGLYDGHKFSFSLKNFVTLLTRMAALSNKQKINHKDTHVQSLLFTMEQNIERMNNREKALAIWSITKLQLSGNLFESLVKNMISSLDQLSFKDLSLLTWSLSKQKVRNSEYFGRISIRLCSILKNSNLKINSEKINKEKETTINPTPVEKKQNSNELSEEESFLEESEEEDISKKYIESENKIEEIDSLSLSMVLWSFGKAQMKDEEFLDLADELIFTNFEKFSFKMLNMVLFTYSKLGHNPKFGELLIKKTIANPDELKASTILTLKTMISSLSNMNLEHKPSDLSPVLKNLADIIIEKNGKNFLSGKFASSLIWILSRNKINEKNLISRLKENVGYQINDLNEKDVAQCFYGFCVWRSLQTRSNSYEDILSLLVERINFLKNKLVRKEKDIIRKGMKIGNYQNKNLSI